MSDTIKKIYDEGDGIFKMVPNFIPVKFGKPGRRLKLFPEDYYAFGTDSGSVKERWFCTVNGTRTKNPKRPDQGLSYIISESGETILFKTVVETLKEELIGKELQEKYGTFPVFAKFFDYETPLYLHFHPKTDIAKEVGCEAKPECYYFPPQLNNYAGIRPSTYMGFNSDTTKEQIAECIEQFSNHNTFATSYSRAFDIEVGTGWYIPAGVVHAPGSLLTYEPQWATDLNCVLENIVCEEIFSEKYLKDIVPERVDDSTAYILDAIDWEANYNPDFKKTYFRPGVELPKVQLGLVEKWICYGNEFITSKEVTIAPCSTITLKDKAAYGCVIIQGFGKFGEFDAEAVNMMHIGDQTADEFFVGIKKATAGVEITNNSTVESMVILQHFGPDNAVYVE